MLRRLVAAALCLTCANAFHPANAPRARSLRAPLARSAPLAAAAFPAGDGGEPTNPSRLSRINRLSTFASILCAVDCTVFPLVLLLLPAASGLSAAWLHDLAHRCSLYFVLPVGTLAASANYAQHRRPWLGAWAASGLLLILLANAHLHFLPHSVGHLFHSHHEVANVLGCALLLSSQWLSHRTLHRMGKACCDHDH